MEKLHLGIAERDITPPLGSHLYGYRDSILAEEIHDPLVLRVFSFRQGGIRLLMISTELGNIGTAYSEELRRRISDETGIPFGHILLSAIHTHTGPNVAEAIGWGKRDTVYSDNVLTPALLSAVREASEHEIPVTMGYAVGESLVGINRRQPAPDNSIILGQWKAGSFDPDMTVVSFRNGAGEVVASMVHYSAHATAAGSIPVVSADWPGVMCRRMKETGAGMTAFFNGTEGDVGPRLSNGKTVSGVDDASGIRYVEEMGNVAARDAVSVFRKINVFREAGLAVREGVLRLPLGKRESPDDARKGIGSFNGKRFNIHFQELDHHEQVLASYENGYAEKDFAEIPQTVVRIGEMSFASFPFEVFSEIGLRVKDAFGKPLCHLGLTNGTLGYFPTDWELSRGGYEVRCFRTRDIQPFAPNADFALIKETLKNLEDI